MANATRSPATPLHKDRRNVILTLDINEAETLLAITGCISGPPSGRRGEMDSICDALCAAGVSHDIRAFGSIHF